MNKFMVNGDELTGRRLEGWVALHPYTIKYLEDQTEELVMLALDHDPNVLSLVREQTDDICKYAMTLNPYTFIYIRKLTPELAQFGCDLEPRLKRYMPGNLLKKMVA